jgi:ADP-ribosyl-[dinitrogen reductase] hydrolase
MSSSSIDDSDPIEIARKLQAYGHLLPPASPAMVAKMLSGQPDAGSAARGRSRDKADKPAATGPALPGPTWPALDPVTGRDRAVGCLLGLAVGDAIGAAVEFKPRDSFTPLTDMIGGGPFSLAPGEWTDDTTMALCLAESLLAKGTVDQADLMTRFAGWLQRGENTVSGRCFDIGATTRAAIESFIASGNPSAGSHLASAAGNASLVRLAPLAIFAHRDRALAELLAGKQSRTTHAALEVIDACRLFTDTLIDALTGADKEGALRQRVMALAPKVLFISAGEYKSKTRDQIRSSGYVVHTLEAAVWSVWQTDNFRDTVLHAANLGDDADSVAATAGQLAGALYGAKGIPDEWLAKLAWREKIEKLANALFDLNPKAG